MEPAARSVWWQEAAAHLDPFGAFAVLRGILHEWAFEPLFYLHRWGHNQEMKRHIISVVMLSGLVSALGAPAIASADGVTFTPVGSIYVPFATPLYGGGPYTIDFERVDAAPGGSTAWHTHPASVYGYVMSGTVTRAFANCSEVSTGAGGTFQEMPGEVHQGRNETNAAASLYVAIIVPDGKPAFAPADAPAC